MSRNIKEIGKELMGKSLNSFHRKTGLTQLEENNKMQDGILNGILSQVDNAYIEKTEQSNVIHLDGSGDGVVVIDSIEGNTMVNLLGRPTKTNNANVTINSNKTISWNKSKITTENYSVIFDNSLAQVDKTYTLVFNILENTMVSESRDTIAKFNIVSYNSGNYFIPTNKTGLIKLLLKQPSTSTGKPYLEVFKNTIGTLTIENPYILEGDWTNKEIPTTLEGLQSSFEEKVNDEGKYEIEILSRIHNLINDISNPHDIKTIYSFYGTKLDQMKPYLKYFNQVEGYHICDNLYDYYYTDNSANIWMNLGTMDKDKALKVLNNRIAEGLGKSNKIKLLLNEPLRGLGNIKDKLCVKDGKLVIQRNVKRLDITSNMINETNFTYDDTCRFTIIRGTNLDNKYNITWGMCEKSISNLVPYKSMWTVDKEGFYIDNKHSDNSAKRSIVIRLSKTKVGNSLNELKTWLNNNEFYIVHPTEEPVYEEVLNEYGEPIILEGYENGTIYIDSTIVPTTTLRYTPKMESMRVVKEVNNNNIMLTNDVNEIIIPYMMEVDMMIMEKEMALPSQINIRKIGEKIMTSMQKRTGEMLERLIKGKSLTKEDAKTRVTVYLNAGKITDAQAEELMLLIEEVYA